LFFIGWAVGGGDMSVFSVTLCVVVVVVFCLVCLILLLLLLLLPLYKFEIGRGFLKEKTVRCFLFGSSLLLSVFVCMFFLGGFGECVGAIWVFAPRGIWSRRGRFGMSRNRVRLRL
jgi:hypothetical protein